MRDDVYQPRMIANGVTNDIMQEWDADQKVAPLPVYTIPYNIRKWKYAAGSIVRAWSAEATRSHMYGTTQSSARMRRNTMVIAKKEQLRMVGVGPSPRRGGPPRKVVRGATPAVQAKVGTHRFGGLPHRLGLTGGSSMTPL